MIRLVAPALVAIVASACSGSTSESTRACNDYLDAFTDVYAEDCGHGDYQTAAEKALKRIGVDSCGDVDRVRNANEFYNQCLPDIVNLACDEIASESSLPSACAGQLVDDDADG